jgi:integrase/recombinase XerC
MSSSPDLPTSTDSLAIVVDMRQPVGLADHRLDDLLRRRVEAALARLAPGSRRQYERTLRLFATWTSSSDSAALLLGGQPSTWWEVLVEMLRAGPLPAATLVETYLSDGCAGKAPATVAQRLAAIRWTIRLAREAGLIVWDLHVRGPKVRAYRDTRGPGVDALRAMLAAVDQLPNLLRERDVALLGLLFVLGLRRAEIAALRVGDVDLAGRRLMVIGKGTQEPAPMTIPTALADPLRAYLDQRGGPPPDAPLMASHDPARRGSGGMTGSGIYRRVRRLAQLASVPGRVTPHGLRHSAITTALDELGGDVRRVRAFARHSKAETTLGYDDKRRDVGGQVAEVLSRLVQASMTLR